MDTAKIKSLIKEGDLKPGDALPPERELVKVFNVSRASLREALNSLTGMGFLEMSQKQRTVVKSLASGRMTACIDPFFDQLGVDGLVMAYNGALIREERIVGNEAGGLGVVQPISLTYVHGHDFREGIHYMRSLTDKPIGMNALIEASSKTYHERMVRWIDIALEEISTYRREALPTMAANIIELDQLTEDSEAAIERMESPATMPREMCSRSASVNARLERRRSRGRIPPVRARMPRTDV